MDHRDDDIFDDNFDEQGNDREEQGRSFLNIRFSVCDVFSSNTKSTSGIYCVFFVDYQKEICSESRVTLYMRQALDGEAQKPGWASFPCGDQTAGGQ